MSLADSYAGRCEGCNARVSLAWTYCPFCGSRTGVIGA